MEHSSAHEIPAAVQDLASINAIGKRRGDSAIVVVAAILDALIRLQSRDVDTISEAQRAIAAARAEQFNSSSNSLPQLNALIYFADVTCSLLPYDHEQVVKKMAIMQNYLDQIMSANNWARDGTFAVPLVQTTHQNLTPDTGGIFSKDSDGRDCLTFSWLGRPDVYLIGFLLSGQAVYYRNQSNRGAEKFIAEGLKMTEGMHSKVTCRVLPPR